MHKQHNFWTVAKIKFAEFAGCKLTAASELSYSLQLKMARRRTTEAQRWQVIGMHSAGMSYKTIGRQLGLTTPLSAERIQNAFD